VSAVPFGSSGPARSANGPDLPSDAATVARSAGCSQTGVAYCRTRSDGLAEDCGKSLARMALPAAASDPAGAVVERFRLAVLYAVAARASTAKIATPAQSTATGRRTARAATWPHNPGRSAAGPIVRPGNTTRALTASSAGSRVSPASSITATPSASGTLRSR
jgi:hypothetical protein